MDAYLRLGNDALNHAAIDFTKVIQIQNTMPEALKVEDLKTAPFDPRFPNTNQTRYCYQSYLDYYRCQKIRGTDYKPCDYFKKVFHSICPNAWIEKWDSQREEGTFAGNI